MYGSRSIERWVHLEHHDVLEVSLKRMVNGHGSLPPPEGRKKVLARWCGRVSGSDHKDHGTQVQAGSYLYNIVSLKNSN